MSWILNLILAIVVLAIVYKIFYEIFRKLPWLRFVLALALGVGAYFLWHVWWGSLLVFFFSFGLFIVMTKTTTRRGNPINCPNCDNDVLDIIEETDDYVDIYCPKCKHESRIHLYR